MMKQLSWTFCIQEAGANGEVLLRILSVDKISRTIRLPVNGIIRCVKCSELESLIHKMWLTAVLRVKSVEIHGNDAIIMKIKRCI